jgi:hypothetical protein
MEQKAARALAALTDSELVLLVMQAGPVNDAVNEIASRVVGIVGLQTPGATAHLSMRLDEIAQAEIATAVLNVIICARKITEEADKS